MNNKAKYYLISVGENAFRMLQEFSPSDVDLTQICLCDLQNMAYWDAVDAFFSDKKDIIKDKNHTIQRFDKNRVMNLIHPNRSGQVIFEAENKGWQFINTPDLRNSRFTNIEILRTIEVSLEENVIFILTADLSEMSTNTIKQIEHLLFKYLQQVVFIGIIPFVFKGEEKHKYAVSLRNRLRNYTNFTCFDENDCIKGEDPTLKVAIDRSSREFFELLSTAMSLS